MIEQSRDALTLRDAEQLENAVDRAGMHCVRTLEIVDIDKVVDPGRSSLLGDAGSDIPETVETGAIIETELLHHSVPRV